MKKRDILGLIRLDAQRKNKPKKSLDDFLLGGEDQHEEIMKDKRSPDHPKKKKSVMEEQVGVSKSDEAAQKPTVQKLDWGSLAKMSTREQNITLKREYLSLLEKLEDTSAQVMNERGQVNEKEILLEKTKKDIKLLRDFLRDIVGIIPDGYDIRMQMDTTAWTVHDIKEEVIQKIKSMVSKLRFTNQLIEEETKKEKAQKQFLENELGRARERIRDLESMIINNAHSADGNPNTESNIQVNTSEKEVAVSTDAPTIPSSNTSKPPDIEISAGNNQVKVDRNPFDANSSGTIVVPEIPDEVPKYIFLETERYLEDFPDECKVVLEVIGKTGVSRNAELKIEMESNEAGRKYFFPNDKFEYGYLNGAVKTLKDRQFINSKEINLGARGYKFLVYELTDIGKAIYYKFTQQQPTEPEMTKMLGDHKSLEHGYLIREVANEFRIKGYTVFEDRESCTYKLDNNKRKVFDLIIEKDGNKKHIEVERGTHNDDDFFKAMDKIYQVTNEFYFVAPNEKILYQITKGKVFKWITDRLGGFENAKGKMKMHFSTIEKIKKSDDPWEIFAL